MKEETHIHDIRCQFDAESSGKHAHDLDITNKPIELKILIFDQSHLFSDEAGLVFEDIHHSFFIE